VLPDGLEGAVMKRENRNLLLDGRLVLVSPYDPAAGFNVGHAMQRNKVVYALSDAALVVNAEVDKGGTWAGAVEQLERLHLVPVYVRSTGDPSPGLAALRDRGALAWPNPEDAEGLAAALRAKAVPEPSSTPQCELAFVAQDEVREPAPHGARRSRRGARE
jgi:predicted Rossmann fold nucleotide-binding protein DprA/Smf involved in DNA uptake